MKIVQKTFGNVQLLRLEGKLDVHSTPTLLALLDDFAADNYINVVIDMRQVMFISSYGVGAMVTILKNIRERGGHLKLAAMRPEVKVPFEITGLMPQFEIHDSVENAIGSF